MFARNFLTSVIAALAIAMPVQSSAQAALFDVNELLVECQADCATHITALAALLRAQGLSPVQINEQIGLIAATLVAEAETASPEFRLQIAQGLRAAAGLSTDPRQQAAIITVAAAVEAGESVDIDIAVAASPA